MRYLLVPRMCMFAVRSKVISKSIRVRDGQMTLNPLRPVKLFWGGKKSNELFPFSNKGPHPKANERKRLTHFTHFWIISFNLVGNLKLALLTKPKSLTHCKFSYSIHSMSSYFKISLVQYNVHLTINGFGNFGQLGLEMASQCCKDYVF